MNKIYKIGVVSLLIVFGYFYLNASCNNKITFTPEKIISILLSPFVTTANAFVDYRDKGNYYTYKNEQFKTKDEAVKFCIYNKLGF